jgi:hypothetical protein
MGRRNELIIERRFADPGDPDYERDLEIVAEALLKLIGIKTQNKDLPADFTSYLTLPTAEIKYPNY